MASTSKSLADELAADFESDEESQTSQAGDVDLKRSADQAGLDDEEQESAMDVAYFPVGGVKPAEELTAQDVDGMQMSDIASVHSVTKLAQSRRLNECQQNIQNAIEHPVKAVAGAQDPEYHLVVQANNLAVELDNEMLIINKFIKDHYSAHFPELEQLVEDPDLYIRAVKAIGNESDLRKVNMAGVLPPAAIMSITVMATTSQCRQLTENEMKSVDEAFVVLEELDATRKMIFNYVSSKLTLLAPNLSALVGTATAAKMLGVAGGLKAFTGIPACNLILLGAQRKTAVGLAVSTVTKHTGFIYSSELARTASVEYRMQIQRTIASKCALAARMDIAQSRPDGSYGEQCKVELQAHIDRKMNPPPTKAIKALPIPGDPGKKSRRGGRRARAAKDSLEISEARKLANRMAFNEEEMEVTAFDETEGLGMLGAKSGKLRVSASTKTNAKMSRKNQLRTANITAGAATAIAGTASSLAFTPVQGIELVNPLQAEMKLKAANEKWFASGKFTFVGKPAGSS